MSWSVSPILQHTVLILPHVSYEDLVNIVHYVYTGDVSIAAHSLDSFLTAARCLQLSGVQPMEEEDCMPQDLSMKSLHKRTRLEESPPSCPASSAASRPGQESLLSRETAKSPRQTKTGDRHLHQNCKLPSWSQSQLQDAIESVITQRLRFTQASARYGIPKGTLYDNILGKAKRMQVLDQVGLTEAQEMSVLEFCCEISNMPYNRRTSRSLSDVIEFITKLKLEGEKSEFSLSRREGFKWWWAFTKKHNIISLYYQDAAKAEEKHQERQLTSPDNLLNLLNNPTSIPINIQTSSLIPFLGLNNHSKYSLKHPDYLLAPKI